MEDRFGLGALFEYATEGIVVVNGSGVISQLNPAAERLFGFEKGELLGQKIEVLIPSKFAESHRKHRTKYSENPHARSMGAGFDLWALRKDGTEFPVEISLSPFKNEDGEQRVMAFILDITRQKEAEQKLKNYSDELEKEVEQRTLILSEAISELEETKQELKESLMKEKELGNLKTRFVSMVSHEFRTPLATILSSLTLVQRYIEKNDTEKQDKHIERIKSSVNNLTDILNDVLSLSKLEEGKVLVNREEFDFKEFVDEVRTELETIAKPGQTIKCICDDDNYVILSDKKILRHILFNLISNAIKFSPENSEINVSGFIDEDRLHFSIQDQGIGIAEEDQKHLFESFFRAENAINIQGTGLGLNIVARYVNLLDGTVSFKSKLNEGTSFTVEIPKS